MTVQDIISELKTNQKVFENLLKNRAQEEYLWRPQPKKWCLLEIVCHLLDEEREDFRARVKHTLETPLADLKPINPRGWVLERNYINQDYNEELSSFLNERQQSVSWLNTQIKANWDSAISHPALGTMSAKLFLANWLAHDYLHIRQITRCQYFHLQEKTNLDLKYAGNW